MLMTSTTSLYKYGPFHSVKTHFNTIESTNLLREQKQLLFLMKKVLKSIVIVWVYALASQMEKVCAQIKFKLTPSLIYICTRTTIVACILLLS